MRILVVFYSRHNHTKIVGEIMAKKLGATLERIEDLRDREHLISWEESAFDEELKTPTKIADPINDPKNFDLVIIGTPIWDGMAPAVNTYLKKMKGKIKKVAFFITFNAAAEDTAYKMGKILNKKPIGVLEIQDKQIARNEHKELIGGFVEEIKRENLNNYLKHS